MVFRGLILALTLLALPARAEEVVLGLSQAKVSITANFHGSEILIFGAIKRSRALPDGPPLQVIVTVEGPKEPIVVRRKSKRFGIWVNTSSVEVDEAPSYYAVATSAPLKDALKAVEDLRYRITIPQAIRSVGAPMQVKDAQAFTEGLIRIRQEKGLYQQRENSVELSEATLFNTSIDLPASLTEGDYRTRIFLTRGGDIVSHYETEIHVRKVGLERWLYTLARQKSLIYGLMSLAIAIVSGWAASAIFTALRRG